MFKNSISDFRQIISQTTTSTREYIKHTHSRIVTYISRLLPDIHTDITTTKQEIWTDLSHLYYKYDHPHQKTAFREVIKETSHTINEGRWPTAHKRIYRTNNKATPLQRTP